jgi:hypothetical protein
MQLLLLKIFELHALALCQRWLLLRYLYRKLVPQRQGQGSHQQCITMIFSKLGVLSVSSLSS